ncbi:hypothetical protein Pcinc_042006 [Petrolisthes cinctipes]|uniref:Uncharacterized protein n=1 Tax=Petrolisthes cinctipes TaxID=88211 RepID=A0AAE1EGG5_PETCI|nr:hypothetical protein Pcinc_042006 [Petrolisthes cinctipes]
MATKIPPSTRVPQSKIASPPTSLRDSRYFWRQGHYFTGQSFRLRSPAADFLLQDKFWCLGRPAWGRGRPWQAEHHTLPSLKFRAVDERGGVGREESSSRHVCCVAAAKTNPTDTSPYTSLFLPLSLSLTISFSVKPSLAAHNYNLRTSTYQVVRTVKKNPASIAKKKILFKNNSGVSSAVRQ